MSRISPEIQLRNARLAPHLMYICPECGKGFRSQPEWRTHLNIKHDYRKKTISDFDFKQVSERYHECQLCFKWVASEKHTLALIQYHRFLHLPYPQTYRCLHCREAFSRRRALNDHLEQKHFREIKHYEARVKAGRLRQQPQSVKKSELAVEKEDLIRKALLNSHIDLEEELLNSSIKNSEPNASELALDRSLNALEELMRQDMVLKEQPETNVAKTVDKPTEESTTALNVCVKSEHDSTDNESIMCTKFNSIDEIVTIEIDALGADEVEQLINAQPLAQNSNNSVSGGKRSRRKVENEDYETAMIEEIKKHISYLCPECAEEFSSEKDWREHVLIAHDFAALTSTKFKMRNDMRSYKCVQCHDILQTIKRPDLLRHYFQHLPYRSYLKCDFCGRTKSNTGKILNHIQFNHRDEIMLMLGDQIDLDYTNDSGKELKCRICHRKFLFVGKLQKHAKYCERKTRSGPFEEGFKEIIEHLNDAKMRMREIRAQMN